MKRGELYLVSLASKNDVKRQRKSQLTEYIGALPNKKINELDYALLIALGIEAQI